MLGKAINTLRYNRVLCGSMGKQKTSIALDTELLKWIDQEIKTKRFANRTHAIEYALQKLRENQKETE